MNDTEKQNYKNYYLTVSKLFALLYFGKDKVNYDTKLIKLYNADIARREKDSEKWLGSDWLDRKVLQEGVVDNIPLKVELFPEDGDERKLARVVAAIDGALKEFIGTERMVPPSVISIGSIFHERLGLFATIDREDGKAFRGEEKDDDDFCMKWPEESELARYEVLNVRFRSLLNEGQKALPPLEMDGIQKIVGLAKRNYKSLSSWRGRIESKFNAGTEPKCVTNPNDIVWERDDRVPYSHVSLVTTFGGDLVNERW